MIDFLEQLRWLDWVGLALAAYGVVSGAVRGTLHQYTRLLVLLVSLVLVGLIGTPILQAVGSALESDAGRDVLIARLELALFVIALPTLTLLRRWLSGESAGAKNAASRIGGALTGLLASLVLATVAGCAGFWIDGGQVAVDAQASRIGRTIAEWAARAPSPPRPSFLVPRAFPAD